MDDDDSIRSYCWWQPSQSSLPVAFCNETSIHGLRFLGQKKRHLSERIFWLIGLFSSVVVSVYLIHGLYDRYRKVPLTVSFQPQDLGTDRIPFPAVTLCNINNFPKSRVEALQKIAFNMSHPERTKARKQLVFVRNACNAQQSFAKDFNYAFSRGSNNKNPIHKHGYTKPYFFQSPRQPNVSENENEPELTPKDQREIMDFLFQNTMPCNEMIRLCILGREKIECENLFKPIITDYGKCCTFNILPLPLLLKNPESGNKPNSSVYENPVLGSNAEKHWPMSLIENWSKWQFDEGFEISPKLKNPWRQKRAGLPYGLNILVDPNTEDYFCPASDSLGMRYILHKSLEMPHVMEFSSMMQLQKEISIKVHPDVTMADDDIRDYEPEKRLCVFAKEKDLKFHWPYTGGNCVDECTAKFLYNECNCTLFYMPRDNDTYICNSDPDSDDHECTEDAKMVLQQNIKKECGHCETLCEDITYNYETTIADMQANKDIWGDPNLACHPNGTPPWANHKMSIVHIFFGAESTIPKFRKRLYGITDLIANTGGILGLCLGFSILSGVEVVYFFTIRAFCNLFRERATEQKKSQRRKEKRKSNTGCLPLRVLKIVYSYMLQTCCRNPRIAGDTQNTMIFTSGAVIQCTTRRAIRTNSNTPPFYPHDMPRGVTAYENNQGHHFYGQNSFRVQKLLSTSSKPLISQNKVYVYPHLSSGHTCYTK